MKSSSELATVATWDGLAGLIRSGTTDGKFVHASERHFQQVAAGQERGKTVFGSDDRSSFIGTGIHKSQQVETFVLHKGILAPQFMLILDREMKVIETSLLNAGPISAIAAIDPNLEISGTDLVASRRLHDELKYLDIVAMPLCGVGFSNFGHFLYDGLPSVLMVKNLLRDVNIKLVSQPLTDWQKTLLHHLGLLDDCIEITAPTRFKKLIVTSMLSLHLSYPTSFTRIVFDTLKFSIGSSAATGLPTKVFLSRRGVEKRKLVNRDEVEARLLGLGFDIVYTNEISIEDQARRLSAARFVIGESGAAMANIGFCDANGAVIEILPHADLWTRGACNIFGLRWHAFFPHVEIAPDDGTPEWSRISFEIDCDELEAAIKTIRMID